MFTLSRCDLLRRDSLPRDRPRRRPRPPSGSRLAPLHGVEEIAACRPAPTVPSTACGEPQLGPGRRAALSGAQFATRSSILQEEGKFSELFCIRTIYSCSQRATCFCYVDVEKIPAETGEEHQERGGPTCGPVQAENPTSVITGHLTQPIVLWRAPERTSFECVESGYTEIYRNIPQPMSVDTHATKAR